MGYIIAFVFGVLVGVVLKTLWKSKKLDESGKVLKDETLTQDQKLAKLKELWKV